MEKKFEKVLANSLMKEKKVVFDESDVFVAKKCTPMETSQ
jgi:hypothetical protein